MKCPFILSTWSLMLTGIYFAYMRCVVVGDPRLKFAWHTSRRFRPAASHPFTIVAHSHLFPDLEPTQPADLCDDNVVEPRCLDNDNTHICITQQQLSHLVTVYLRPLASNNAAVRAEQRIRKHIRASWQKGVPI